MQERNVRVSYVAVVGTGAAAIRFYRKLNKKKRKHYEIVGFIGDENDKLPAPRLCGMQDLPSYLLSADIDEIVIATDASQVYLMPDIISLCEDSGIQYTIRSESREAEAVDVPAGQPLKTGIRTSGRSRLDNPFWVFIKRAFDFLVSLALIMLLWPVMLVIAIGVKLSGPGSVLIKRKVVGMRRKSFVMYKFRSTEAAGTEEKVTSRFRLFLRDKKLDMLPVLFHILTGSMSFVGPTPEPREFISKYRNSIQGFMQRYRMRPGLFGWARVIARRGDLLIRQEEWTRYDLWYVANWSVRLDLSIIRKTLFEDRSYSETLQLREEKERAAQLEKERREEAARLAAQKAALQKEKEERLAARKAQKAAAVAERERAAKERKERMAAEAAANAKAARNERIAALGQKIGAAGEAVSNALRTVAGAVTAIRSRNETVSNNRGSRSVSVGNDRAARAGDRGLSDAEREKLRRKMERRRAARERAAYTLQAAQDKVRSRGEIVLLVTGYFGRPLLIFFAGVVLIYYLCYRMDPAVFGNLFGALKVVSALLFAITAVLTLKKRSAGQIILLLNLAWMVLTRSILNDLTVGPHGVCYFAAMFFAFYSCGVLLKNRQREYLIDLVTLLLGGVLTVWAVAGIKLAFTGVPFRGFELVRLQVEKTPALMTFISFFGTHRNISSTYFVILMGMSMYSLFHHRTLMWKIAALVFVPISYVTVAMQHSRSNYMAASIVLTVSIGSMVIGRLANRRKHVNVFVAGAVAALCLFLFVSGFYRCNTLVESLANHFRSERAAEMMLLTGENKAGTEIQLSDPRNLQFEIQTLNRRTDIWKAAVPVLREHPQILSIGRPENLVMETINEKLTWKKEPHMHNVFLQQLMVAGAPGVIIYLCFFFAVFRGVFLSLREARHKETQGNWVLGGILAALFAYGMLEPLLSPKIPFASLMFCLIAGCLEGEQRKLQRRDARRRLQFY